MSDHLKFDSSYQPISIKFPTRSGMNCCYIAPCDGATCKFEFFVKFIYLFLCQLIEADGNSTCSISHNDMRRHLIVSTASPSSGIPTSGSDFGTISTASPTTMSTVYQGIINPYLTAVKNDPPNVVSLFLRIQTIEWRILEAELKCNV